MTILKNIFKSIPAISNLYRRLNNQYERDSFVVAELKKIQEGKLILDAGCGNQRYREFCSHLTYKSQDFGLYTTDVKKMIGGYNVGGQDG
jgi:hypothetical protein